MTFFRSPLETDDQLIMLLGLISARWSMMEEALAELLGEVLNNFDTGYELYFAASAFRQRIELLKTAVHSEFEDESSEKLCSLLNRVYDAFKSRNRMIHSPYHAVLEENGELTSAPTVTDTQTGNLVWIGHGRHYDPKRINKGTFSNHLKRLDELIEAIVEELTSLQSSKEDR